MLVSRRIEPANNACAILFILFYFILKIVLQSLEEKKPICFKEYRCRASENKVAFPESWAVGLTMFNIILF